MMNEFIEPAKPVNYEEKIKRSVFIADLSPCHNEQESRSFINTIISQHKNANHHCRAYIFSDQTEYSSDDGEPSGTAGKPILNSIKKSSLVNVIVVVTRYFGGIKLGVRGLIDAYGLTAKKALDLAERVIKINTKSLSISLNYNETGNITKLLNSSNAINLKWIYEAQVKVSCEIPINEYDKISRELNELKARSLIIDWE